MDLDKNEKIYEAVQIKEINTEWNSVRAPEIMYDSSFILTKNLGHPEIANSKCWKQIKECWMCDKWKFTIIFWHTELGFIHQIQDPHVEQLFEKIIYKSKDNFEQLAKQNFGETNCDAYLIGSMTNWEPRRMMAVSELCARLTGSLNDSSDSDSHCDGHQSPAETIKHHQQYKNAFWVNPPDNWNQKVFAYVDFVKPGKHQYLVTFKSRISPDKTLKMTSYH